MYKGRQAPLYDAVAPPFSVKAPLFDPHTSILLYVLYVVVGQQKPVFLKLAPE